MTFEERARREGSYAVQPSLAANANRSGPALYKGGPTLHRDGGTPREWAIHAERWIREVGSPKLLKLDAEVRSGKLDPDQVRDRKDRFDRIRQQAEKEAWSLLSPEERRSAWDYLSMLGSDFNEAIEVGYRRWRATANRSNNRRNRCGCQR